jgi:enoyl-CoA hydratase
MEANIQSAEYLKEVGFIDYIYSNNAISSCETYLEKLFAADSLVLESYKLMWIRKWEENKLRERIEKEVSNCSVLWESESHHNYVKNFISKKTKKYE